MPRHSKITVEQLKECLFLKMRDEDIAAKYGMHPGALRRKRNSLGLGLGQRQRRGIVVSAARDRDMRDLASRGFTGRQISAELDELGHRHIGGRAIALRCKFLGVKLARARPDRDDEPPEMTQSRLEEAEAKMAAAMAGHSYEDLRIKSYGTPKFPRPITHCETASSAALAVV